MKKVFFAALLTVSVALSSFAAGVNNVNMGVSNSFKAQFAKATNVTWNVTDEFAKATFVLDGEKMEAFYSPAGDVIATSKSVSLDALPVSAKRSFAKKYDGYTVKEVIQFDGAEESAYYISAENEKQTVILKVGSNEALSTYKTDKK